MRRRCAALICATLLLLTWTVGAAAHASLVKAEPAAGAVLRDGPSVLTLTFNEPVSPLVLRLLGPAGETIDLGAVTAKDATVWVDMPHLRRGTHVLSWRVISTDGHPVGGTITFSIGAPSGREPADGAIPRVPAVAIALWAVRVILYVGLLIGVGGMFFWTWVSDPLCRTGSVCSRWPLAPFCAALLALLAAAFSLGLQGADALDLPLPALMRALTWKTGLATSYGLTAIAAAGASLASLLSALAKSRPAARALSLAGLVGVGVALSLSGHASTANPQYLSRPAVLLHAVCITFWIGSLLPLYRSLRDASWDGRELGTFSRFVPLPVAIVAVTGLWLAAVQLRSVEALWVTPYGEVLLCKLMAVAALLGLAALNRYRLAPRWQRGNAAAARPLRASIVLEIALAVTIAALVALWRFTPPPRALTDALPLTVHLHGEKAMAEVTFARNDGGAVSANLIVLDGDFRPLAAKEVTLVLANPSASIEPTRWRAARIEDSTWRVEDVRAPVAGRWDLSVEVLVTDFDKAMVADTTALPRMP